MDRSRSTYERLEAPQSFTFASSNRQNPSVSVTTHGTRSFKAYLRSTTRRARQGQRREVKVFIFLFFLDVGPVRRVGGANWASFSGMWWVVVLTTWVGGGAGLDAGLAAQATPVERGIQLRLDSVVFWWCFGGEIGRGRGFQFRRWRVGGGQNRHAGLNSGCGRASGRHRADRGAARWGGLPAWRRE